MWLFLFSPILENRAADMNVKGQVMVPSENADFRVPKSISDLIEAAEVGCGDRPENQAVHTETNVSKRQKNSGNLGLTEEKSQF